MCLSGEALLKRVLVLACRTQKEPCLLGLNKEHRSEMQGKHSTALRGVVSGC